ncbi:uncharacterized protein PHALS_09165 [Plasmopara halstedii]|uniref:Uncharacterized protein n=1 Tax=Plasmopara halstedii TaxID=4781 RepID=A0A0P1AEM2_PLAHL|nr:uncharacterized protein PHALS_09165 [Plasmopara halstedii]CEG39106.1 hypothetical protein PHALS_09165 [Plasmopara halstedii]|eukprot:XP_024575475.1 hypothetical protein PHALS_09165 [Plasmopara halstedii]
MQDRDEKGIDTKPYLDRYEKMLQEMKQYEELKQEESIKNMSAITKQKLLSEHLQQTQAELAETHESKAKLCEEIGILKQTKEHQSKQLDRYKLDLQTARELNAILVKKMEKLEASTGIIKQQYIRSLALRIKSSALALQQLNVLHGDSSHARIAEVCSELGQTGQSKRKRISAVEIDHRALEEVGKPEHAGNAVKIESSEDILQTADNTKKDIDWESNRDSLLIASNDVSQQNIEGTESEHQIQDLLAQITKLETKKSALNDEYTALELKHTEVLNDVNQLVENIKERDSKIEELEGMLKVAHSTQLADGKNASEERTAIDGRLKLLEDNLSQMNSYADHLEMVIAQCPACTKKLQNESTQDSVSNKTE